MDRPNIVLIYTDQHRGDCLGCVGHTAIKTPNLDRIASESVTFTRCHTNAPLCMPARATMMTGQYVREHGVWDNSSLCADPKGPSHVRNIREAGYVTAEIGKTHLHAYHIHPENDTGRAEGKISILKDWGFDHIHELYGPHSSGELESPYSDYLRELGLWDTHREFMRLSRARVKGGQARPWEDLPSPLPCESHLDSYTGRTAAEWIRDYTGGRPFYLQVLFPGPHNPFDSPSLYRDMYSPLDMPEGIMALPEGPHPPYIAAALRRSASGKAMTVEEKKRLLVNYYAKITLIDAAIGGILDALRETNRMGNTWLVYSSDHGEMAGDHRLHHKSTFYDAAVRVPLIIRPPAGMAGWRCAGLVDSLDMTATLLDISGAVPLRSSDGKSLVQKVLAGPEARGAQVGKGVVFSELVGHTMMFDGRYKLVVETRSQKAVEFYDWGIDPDELNNRADDPALASTRQHLTETHLSRIATRLDETLLKRHEEAVGMD